MDWRDGYQQNYLASLLSSTAPPPTRRQSHATENYRQGGTYLSYPSPNAHEHRPYTRPHTNTSYQVPPNQTLQYMQMHPANTDLTQAGYYQAPHTVNYPGHPFQTAPTSQYDVRPLNVPTRPSPAVPDTQDRPTYETPSPEMDRPTRRLIEELEVEEESDEKPVRVSRRIRKPRKLTPVLVFDNDSDDGDYEDRTRGKKRKKVHYDSESAIDVENTVNDGGADETESARSSTEEVDEPLETEEVEEPQPKPKSPTKNRRKRARKESLARKNKTTDAKAKAEKASSLLKRKGKGRPIPKTVEECDEADLMMWQWKHNGRNWKDIREEWVRIMGVKPGRSSLSVRLAKMEDNFIDNGAANDLMILKYKEEVEAELEDLKWQKVAQKIKEERDIDLKPAIVRKRFNELKENGWVVGAETGDKKGDEGDNMEEVGDPESADEKHDVEDDAE